MTSFHFSLANVQQTAFVIIALNLVVSITGNLCINCKLKEEDSTCTMLGFLLVERK